MNANQNVYLDKNVFDILFSTNEVLANTLSFEAAIESKPFIDASSHLYKRVRPSVRP